MTDALKQLLPHDEKLIRSLPYRVGMYISTCDISGGDQAAQVERQELINILTQYVEDYYQTPLVNEIMRVSLSSQEEWPVWEDKLYEVPGDLERALPIVKPMMDDKEYALFKTLIFDICVSVAMAFQEDRPFIGFMERRDLKAFLVYIGQWVIFYLLSPPALRRARVSLEERKAIIKLRKILSRG